LVLGAQVYDADVEGVVRAAAAGALALELAPDLLGEPDLRASSHRRPSLPDEAAVSSFLEEREVPRTVTVS
jgi:hypothetical protein